MLDPARGARRVEHVRARLKGLTKNRTWFSGERRCLRYIMDISVQPGGVTKMLDLLDMIDAKRAELQEGINSGAQKVLRDTTSRSNCVRRYRLRGRAAILTEEIRRAKVGEPPMTKADEKAFLKRRQHYWNRLTDQYKEELESIPGSNLRVYEIASKVSSRILKEELEKLAKARQGIHELSDVAKRRLNSPSRTVMWKALNEAMAEFSIKQ